MVPKVDYIVNNSGKNSSMTTKKIGDPIGAKEAENATPDQFRKMPQIHKK